MNSILGYMTKVVVREGFFIPHCDDDDYCDCGLGRFHYQCPHCNLWNDDFDFLWWKQDELIEGTVHTFYCEDCKEMLHVAYEKSEDIFKVAHSPYGIFI